MHLLRVKIAQGELRPNFSRVGRQHLFHFVHGIRHITRRFERERKIVARVQRIRPDGQRRFIGGQCRVKFRSRNASTP